MKHHSEIMSRFAKVDTDKPTTPRENRNDGSDEKTQRMASSNRGWRTSSTHFRWGLSWAPGQRFLAPAWFPQGQKVCFTLTEVTPPFNTDISQSIPSRFAQKAPLPPARSARKPFANGTQAWRRSALSLTAS